MSRMPITKVGSDTPTSETVSTKRLSQLSRLRPVKTPRPMPAASAMTAETNTSSSVAGMRSRIRSETLRWNW